MHNNISLVSFDSSDLEGRIPYKLIVTDNSKLLFKWIYIGNKKFTEPFFEESIAACLSLPQNTSMPFTTTDTLLKVASTMDSIQPSGFIFHISRCGSTLLTQMLSLDKRIISLSEVPLLDAILRLPFSHIEKQFDQQDEVFKAVIQIMAQKKSGNEKHLFIKTDSWHLHLHNDIRKIFPLVPFILLYRNPSEVIRSQKKQKGMHAVQHIIEPQVFGLSSQSIESLSPSHYLEKVLESYFEKCIEILGKDNHSFSINYKIGVMEMLNKTISACSIEIDPSVLIQMENRTQQHSKKPEMKFSRELELVENYSAIDLDPIYKKLQVMELNRATSTSNSNFKQEYQ